MPGISDQAHLDIIYCWLDSYSVAEHFHSYFKYNTENINIRIASGATHKYLYQSRIFDIDK